MVKKNPMNTRQAQAKIKNPHADRKNSPPEEQIIPEAEELPPPTMAQLAHVSEIAQAQVKLLKEQAEIIKQLEENERALKANQEVTLPEAMVKIGMDSFSLMGQIPVKLERNVRAGIPSKDNQPELHEQGMKYAMANMPDLVKRQAVLGYEKGMEKKKVLILNRLFKTFQKELKTNKIPLDVEFKDSVHGGSLTKWVKTQDTLGNHIPEDILGVHRSKKAVVILPKETPGQ